MPLEENPQIWLFLLKSFLNVTGPILKARITKSIYFEYFGIKLL